MIVSCMIVEMVFVSTAFCVTLKRIQTLVSLKDWVDNYVICNM